MGDLGINSQGSTCHLFSILFFCLFSFVCGNLTVLGGNMILRCNISHDLYVPEVPFHRYLMEKMINYGNQIAIVKFNSLPITI